MLISDGVVTLSNARLVTFAVHDSTDWTPVNGLLMMPRYGTPAGSAEPTSPSNDTSRLHLEELADTRVFPHHIADKARALGDRGSALSPRHHAHVCHNDLHR